MSWWRRLFSPKPTVSCLTVTRNRVDMLRRAVACFRHQTVKNAELIIVHDHDDMETARYARTIECAAIRVVQAPAGLKLGALRNLAIASARSDLVAQWDDDDWYAPDRLRLQLRRLRRTGKQACVLRRWTIYDVETGRAFISNPREWEGSIVARRKTLDAYDASRARGEDTPVVEALIRRGEIALLDRPDLYVYVYHGQNTYDRQHWEDLFAWARPLSPEATERVRSRLSMAGDPMPIPTPPAPADPRART